MKRLWPMRLLIILLLAALACGPARAAGPVVTNPAPATQTPATQTPATPAPAGLTATQARQALDVLNDPQKRAQVAATLEAILRAEPVVAPAPAHPAAGTTKTQSPPATPAPAAPAAQPPKVRLEPNSLGAALLVSASGFASHLSTQAIRSVQTVRSLSLLWGWAVIMATNPLAQTLLREAAWRVAVAFAIALAVEWGIGRLMLRPIRVLELRSPDGAPERSSPLEESLEESGEARAEAGETEPPRSRRVAAATLLKRLPLVLLRFVLDLLPVIAFVIIGHLVAASPLGGSDQTRLIILAMVDAYAICGAVMCFSRMMLSPQRKRLRLLRISDANAQWATRWIRRIAVVAVFGYAIAEVGLLLGMSALAHDGLLKAAGLIVHLSLVIMVLQKRRTVARLLRAPPGATGVFARIRNAVAPIWHWVAVFFLIAIWIVAAAEIRNGFAEVLRYFVEIVLVATVARLLLIVLLGSLDRTMRLRPELLERYPGLELRLKAYHPLLHGIARTIVYCAAAFVLLELWGAPLGAWFAGSLLGRRLIAGLGTMVLTLLLALALWEAANAAIESHMARLTRAQQLPRATRLRTLMPLLRTTLLVVILVIAGLTVLSEIGINIAPLLAGAGIIGVAIGFGSQKLVQDLITGIFLLLENAMQVGDSVTVSGLSGTVEHLSVRTIRLRAGDGSVHLIPFSAVTSVTNTNRGLGNAAVSVTIAYSEDTDRATATLKEIAAGMRQEAEYGTRMLSDLQVWGVDKMDGASATITGQIPCTDTGRWPVQREFNRRVKMRFQEQGISLWNPAQTYVVPVVTGSERLTLSGPREEAAE